MKLKITNKFLLGFGSIALVASPIALAASCGESSSSDTNNTNNTNTTTTLTTEQKMSKVANLFSLGKLSEWAYEIEKDASGNEVKLVTTVEAVDKQIMLAKANAEPQNVIDALVVKKERAQRLLSGESLIQISIGEATWWYTQVAVMLHAALYDTEQTLYPADNDWYTDKPFVKLLRALGKEYLEPATNFLAIKFWADKYIALMARIKSPNPGDYGKDLDNILLDFLSLGDAAEKFVIASHIAMKALRWGNGEFTELGLALIIKPIGLATTDIASLRSTITTPEITRFAFGANSNETIKDGKLTTAEQTALNGKKVLSISSSSTTAVELPQGIYMDGEITNNSRPVSGAKIEILRMPAGGKPIAFNDTEIKIAGGKFGTAGKSFVYYREFNNEAKFISKETYDSLTTKTAEAVASLPEASRQETALFLASTYSAVSPAITNATDILPFSAVWSPVTAGFVYSLPAMSLLPADGTKTKSVYIYKLDTNGQMPQTLKTIIEKIASAYKNKF